MPVATRIMVAIGTSKAIRHDGDAVRGDPRKKPEHKGKHHEIGKGAARVKKEHARVEKRSGKPLLLPVKGRGHECPKLIEDDRDRQDQGQQQRQFERCQEGRGHVYRDHAAAFRQYRRQRRRKPCVKLSSKGQ
jgi:hypothetical protein